MAGVNATSTIPAPWRAPLVVLLVLIVIFILAAVCLNRCSTEMGPAKEIQKAGGFVTFKHFGPKWLARALGNNDPFKSIDVVEMGANNVDGDLRVLKSLHDLKMLMLSGTRISGSGLTNLTALPELELVDLAKSGITDDGLGCLVAPGIRRLNLARTAITDAGLFHLQRLTNLASLDLQSTRVTDTGLHYLVQLPLRDLNLKGTLVTSEGITFMTNQNPALNVIP